MTDVVENDILNNKYTLFQKMMYGGVFYGVIVIPTHWITLLFTLIFPPIGEILNSITNYIVDTFPWITWDALKHLFEYEVLTRIIYSLLLTSMFYFPGLIYTLSKLTINNSKIQGTLQCNSDGACIDLTDEKEQAKIQKEQAKIQKNNKKQ